MSRDDLIQICGPADGIRLFNTMKGRWDVTISFTGQACSYIEEFHCGLYFSMHSYTIMVWMIYRHTAKQIYSINIETIHLQPLKMSMYKWTSVCKLLIGCKKCRSVWVMNKYMYIVGNVSRLLFSNCSPKEAIHMKLYIKTRKGQELTGKWILLHQCPLLLAVSFALCDFVVHEPSRPKIVSPPLIWQPKVVYWVSQKYMKWPQLLNTALDGGGM